MYNVIHNIHIKLQFTLKSGPHDVNKHNMFMKYKCNSFISIPGKQIVRIVHYWFTFVFAIFEFQTIYNRIIQ